MQMMLNEMAVIGCCLVSMSAEEYLKIFFVGNLRLFFQSYFNWLSESFKFFIIYYRKR